MQRRQYRNYALIVLGVCTALRISDLLRMTWNDVYDKQRKAFHTHVTVAERKTGKTKVVALNKQAIKALRLYFPHKRGDYIFSNNMKTPRAISRVQAWRIMKAAVKTLGIIGKVALHSLRKSMAYHAWIGGMASPVVIMDILNHNNYETTRRYLGVAQDDRDAVYMGLAFF